MNDDELPPIGADDDDARWSVERGKEVADGGAGTGSSGDEPAGDVVGADDARPFPGNKLGEEPEAGSPGGDARGHDMDIPDFVGPTVTRGGPARSRRRGKKPRMWHESLHVEMPPRLNFLSVGIGFALGFGFCMAMVALGYLPGSSGVPERGGMRGPIPIREVIAPPVAEERAALPSHKGRERGDRPADRPAEGLENEGDPAIGGDGEPVDRPEEAPKNSADALPGNPAGAGE